MPDRNGHFDELFFPNREIRIKAHLFFGKGESMRVYTWWEITLIAAVTAFGVLTAGSVAMLIVSKKSKIKNDQKGGRADKSPPFFGAAIKILLQDQFFEISPSVQ